MKVIIKKNYFWSKKIKTWEYLSNRKGLQRDLGVLIILRSRLKVWESDSRFSLWLTESILSSCNSSGPLYLQDFRSWKQCWGKTYTQPPSLTIMCYFFSFCKHNIHLLRRQDDGKVQVLEGAGRILRQDQTLVTVADSKWTPKFPFDFCSWTSTRHAVNVSFQPITYNDLSNMPE